jgi:O-antigen ligase
MKWLFLVVALLAVLPLSIWLRGNPRQAPKVWALFGLLIFSHGPLHLYMALVSSVAWPSHTAGLEISVVDLLALAFLLSLPRAQTALPFRLEMLFYFLACVLSIVQAQVMMPALFYPWQLARLFVVYLAVARASAMDDRVAPSILKGMALALCIQTAIALGERLGHGAVQASGLFEHQNLIGLLSHFVIFPYFALLMSGGSALLPGIVTLAGSLLAVLTTSRATVGLTALGFAALFLASIMHGWTGRKALIALMGAAALAVLAPLAISSFDARFAKEQRLTNGSTYDERAALESAASRMLSDHPMGVGTNHFVLAANLGGYYTRAGVAWTSASAHVHNVYWLVAAETGYIGLVAFMILLLRPLLVALSYGWRSHGDKRGELLFGMGVALLTVYLHCLYEWVFITFKVEYVFAAIVGMVAGLAIQLGYRRRA